MKYAYIIEIGQLNNKKNEFFFYDMEVFSTKKAAEKYINNRIDVNNGYNVSIEKSKLGFRQGEVEQVVYTYSCMSAPGADEPSVPMRLRYVLRKMKINN